jgi:hypothetical protein
MLLGFTLPQHSRHRCEKAERQGSNVGKYRPARRTRVQILAVIAAFALVVSAPLAIAETAVGAGLVDQSGTSSAVFAPRSSERLVFSLHARSGAEQFEASVRSLLRRPDRSRDEAAASLAATLLVLARRRRRTRSPSSTITVIRHRFLRRRGPPAFAL